VRVSARVHRLRPRTAGRWRWGTLRGSPKPLRYAAPARPWQAILIALALLLVQGPSLFHLLVVPHATCEHGELVEAGPTPASPHADATNARPSAEHPRIDRGREGGHEHCDALAVRHRLPDVGVFVAPATLLPVTLIDAGGERLEARPVPILSLAPKSSPPV
jgi:hypothetical protein